MRLSSRLDCDLVAVEQTDELTLLVELTAPSPTSDVHRAPATLQVVLDRSGSMGGERLDGAITALLALIDRLDPADQLGIVAFDDAVQVVVPAGPLADKAGAKRAVAAVQAGGSTDLSGGYLRGLQEAQRVAGPAGATVLLISDGHANSGVRDPQVLSRIAAEAHSGRISTSTLGFGLGYDERLLAAISRGGAGNELFAEQADTAIGLIGGEVEGLLDQVVQAASLRLRWSDRVTALHVLNDVPLIALPDGAVLELGSFYAGETRRLLLSLQVPGIAALGLAEVATLELTHVSLPDLVQHTVSFPVTVNVVPGDQAAGRVRDPEVRSERLFQQAQQVKRRSSELLSNGRSREAEDLLRSTGGDLRAQAQDLPDAYAAELVSEAHLLSSLAEEAVLDSSRAAKTTSYDATYKSRNRGRASRGGRFLLTDLDGAALSVEPWELQQLARLLPPELEIAVRPSSAPVTAVVAQLLAGQVGAEHRLHDFLRTAAASGGFTVERW